MAFDIAAWLSNGTSAPAGRNPSVVIATLANMVARGGPAGPVGPVAPVAPAAPV